ncbi:MAG: hypothetical protein ACLFNB_04975, partial [Candidatus Woesearchaeota archaeon]
TVTFLISKLKNTYKMNKRKLEIFLEFLIFGVVMGIVEDIIAVKVASGEPITWNVLWVVTLVAIPFAIIGELIVDRVHLIPPDDKGTDKKSKKVKKE